jgi:hypothetical protein
LLRRTVARKGNRPNLLDRGIGPLVYDSADHVRPDSESSMLLIDPHWTEVTLARRDLVLELRDSPHREGYR